jgi:D-glycero-alpha-D-manno-heptose-7-phosphate kinase
MGQSWYQARTRAAPATAGGGVTNERHHGGAGLREAGVSRAAVEATAPTRIDLAGGTLDIWPLYLFHPGAVTVNTAIDRRAWCRVETGHEGLKIESKDTLRKAEGRDVSEALVGGELSLVAYILRALDVETGVKVVTQSRVPAGSGLGGSSALSVAVAAAVAAATDRKIDPDALWPVVRDAEAQAIGVPTGVQDYLAAIHGSVLGIHLEPGAVRVEKLKTDPARVEESLILVDSGVSHFSGLNNWEVFKGQIEKNPNVQACLAAIVEAAQRVRECLVEGRYDEVGRHMTAEMEARKKLAPGVSAGGAAMGCGAGGGGMVSVWAIPGTREKVEEALRKEGFKPAAFRLDLRGLEVD